MYPECRLLKFMVASSLSLSDTGLLKSYHDSDNRLHSYVHRLANNSYFYSILCATKNGFRSEFGEIVVFNDNYLNILLATYYPCGSSPSNPFYN